MCFVIRGLAMGIIVYVLPIIVVLLIIFVFFSIFGGFTTNKILSSQVKNLRKTTEESKDDLEKISTNMAAAQKTSVETTFRAIKKGFTEEDSVFCKYCSNEIDNDSIFCKLCGKKQ